MSMFTANDVFNAAEEAERARKPREAEMLRELHRRVMLDSTSAKCVVGCVHLQGVDESGNPVQFKRGQSVRVYPL